MDAVWSGVDDEQKAVVDDGSTVLVCDLKGLTVEQDGDGAYPLGVPDLIVDLASVGAVPGYVLFDGALFGRADFAVLKELATMEVGMRET